VFLLLIAPLLAVTLVFLVEIVVGLPRSADEEPRDVACRNVIVIPAHDEESGIGATLESLRDTLGALRDVVVVADNCTDATAAISRSAGAVVLERNDTGLRGKGYALDFAKSHLRRSPPDVIVVLDADCRMDQRSVSALTAAAMAVHRPCQAINLLTLPHDASSLVRISTFAFLVKNLVRQRGLQRLAKSVHLTGTGMAFPWSIFEKSHLATGDIVEDLSLGLALRQQGHSPHLVTSATVTSPAASAEGTLAQRRRWEGGYLRTSATLAPRLLIRSLSRGDLRGLLCALDLFIPPVALLAGANAIAVGGLLIATVTGMASARLALAAEALLFALSTAALGAVWWRDGRAVLRVRDVAAVPFYVLRKLPFYVKLTFLGAPREWIRGERRVP
jgi:cellulose synthase/poly-beta-1,6-N-acetylglucosamine synthase-like glycosyltransferase